MSKFFKALEEAERDRATRRGTAPDATRPSVPVVSAPVPTVPPRSMGTPGYRPAPPAADPPEGVDEHLVSLLRPTTFEAEQYRALRHIVEHRSRAAGLRVLAVSSPGPGDGKTVTAINLAGALAQAPEARVLLVDADLRRPSVGRLLGLDDASGPGLVGGILDSRLGLEEIVQSRPPYNLCVVCAGATPASPYDVLKSPRFAALLEEARHLYDYTVLDTAPLTPVQDCRVIEHWVDGFLLVVAALSTPRRLVEEALTILDPAKILGFVFNADEEPTLSGYHLQHYRDPYPASRPPSCAQSGRLTRAVISVGDSLRRRPSPDLPKGAPRREER
jgi:capsular exopolysaccharide synthesis family protein